MFLVLYLVLYVINTGCRREGKGSRRNCVLVYWLIQPFPPKKTTAKTGLLQPCLLGGDSSLPSQGFQSRCLPPYVTKRTAFNRFLAQQYKRYLLASACKASTMSQWQHICRFVNDFNISDNANSATSRQHPKCSFTNSTPSKALPNNQPTRFCNQLNQLTRNRPGTHATNPTRTSQPTSQTPGGRKVLMASSFPSLPQVPKTTNETPLCQVQ